MSPLVEHRVEGRNLTVECIGHVLGVGPRRPPVIGQSGQTQRFLQILFFPPDFPPNSSLQGGKWHHGTVSSQLRKPYFSGQNGTAPYGTGWAATV
jgi:hypothetical protein